jgi:hypothetical protein
MVIYSFSLIAFYDLDETSMDLENSNVFVLVEVIPG